MNAPVGSYEAALGVLTDFAVADDVVSVGMLAMSFRGCWGRCVRRGPSWPRLDVNGGGGAPGAKRGRTTAEVSRRGVAGSRKSNGPTALREGLGVRHGSERLRPWVVALGGELVENFGEFSVVEQLGYR